MFVVEATDCYLAIGLGVVTTALVFISLVAYRQLVETKRQLSALRIQVGTLRFQMADLTRDRPPGDPPPAAAPPKGTRRKGNLWLVPAASGGAVGAGRALRSLLNYYRGPLALLFMGALAAVAAILYLGGAFHRSSNIQAEPTPPRHTITVPPGPKPQHHAALTRKPNPRRSSPFAPLSFTPVRQHADVTVILTGPQQPSSPAPTPVRSPAPTMSSTPPAATPTPRTPTPTPSLSDGCVSTRATAGDVVCLAR